MKLLSCAGLLATPWTAAHQAPPSMGFSRQEYWSGVPSPSPEPPGLVHHYCSLCMCTQLLSCVQLCDPMDSSLPSMLTAIIKISIQINMSRLVLSDALMLRKGREFREWNAPLLMKLLIHVLVYLSFLSRIFHSSA